MIPLPGGLLVKGIVALGLAAAVAFALWRLHAAVYDSGYRDGYAKLTEYQAAQTERTVEVIREVEKIVTQVEVKYVDRIRVVRERGETIVKEVPVYVTKADDSACELRVGFVRTVDRAAGFDVAGTAGESPGDREPAGVALSSAAEVIADNYKTCRIWRQQVEGWDEFWEKYRATLSNAVCLPKETP